MFDQFSKIGRGVGVLLHPSALPNSPACGGFGSSARQWLKCLSEYGISVWQFLPLGPADSYGSPYSSPSSFAVNPWFLDCNDLLEEGFISESDMRSLPGYQDESVSRVDFLLAELRSQKLGERLRERWSSQPKTRHLAFQLWCKRQFWLDDHALFMDLRKSFLGIPWWKWPEPLAGYKRSALNRWEAEHKCQLLEHRLLQWHLDRQWKVVRKIAKEEGVLLFGDLPFYVSHNSADVWSRRALFSIGPNGELEEQSGVPPDYFSESGQLWGTPVYKWSNHLSTRFRWWRGRVARHFQQVDLLRLDHFRAFESSRVSTSIYSTYWKTGSLSNIWSFSILSR